MDGTRRRRGFVAAGIVATLCKRLQVIIAAQHQQGGWVLGAQGLGNVCEVARVKGHSHRAARGFMQACGCGVALCYQQHGGRGRIAAHSLDDVPQPRLAATLQKQLVGALSGFLRGDALNIPQRARCIAQGHQ